MHADCIKKLIGKSIPLLVYGKAVKPVNLGTRESFADIGKTIAHLLGVETEMAGESFAQQIL